ncbi:hypothetical protein F4803DRAFT_1315 [Xylaria telfairii]|nr:hypothetical protein F4803DRAFT_1315 [Xylaria telfairii]
MIHTPCACICSEFRKTPVPVEPLALTTYGDSVVAAANPPTYIRTRDFGVLESAATIVGHGHGTYIAHRSLPSAIENSNGPNSQVLWYSIRQRLHSLAFPAIVAFPVGVSFPQTYNNQLVTARSPTAYYRFTVRQREGASVRRAPEARETGPVCVNDASASRMTRKLFPATGNRMRASFSRRALSCLHFLAWILIASPLPYFSPTVGQSLLPQLGILPSCF